MSFDKAKRRLRIRRSIRNKVSGTAQRPRLAVFRSNKFIYAQIIDDVNGVTLASSSSAKVEATAGENKTGASAHVGRDIATKALAQGITEVVFDRGGYLYHGRVKSLAEGAREAGLKF
jgi:large subunit ribosomal protein L18